MTPEVQKAIDDVLQIQEWVQEARLRKYGNYETALDERITALREAMAKQHVTATWVPKAPCPRC
jgi:hypothetical protein